MTRQRKMIELVLRNLREASSSADRIRYEERDEHKARVVLAVAVDEALADLDHALSTSPCNHGACKGTMITPVRYTCHGHTVTPLWETKRRVAGGDAIDVIVHDEFHAGSRRHATVNAANITEVAS